MASEAGAKVYEAALQVRFNHCDPAGIVFYPRYFEMVNEVMERFFEDVVDYPYAQMHRYDDVGVPTGALEAAFHAPSYIGDVLNFSLSVLKLGRTSLGVHLAGRCGEEARLTVRKTLIFIDKNDGRPQPWTEPMRERFAPYVADGETPKL